jgi:sulfoxide reductase heme-binding subunit YedZ
MPTRWIPYFKILVHLLCLAPFLWLFQQYRTGGLAAQADPVNYITHFTGDWALWLLLVSLAVTPIRRIHARLSNLIRFRRLLGLYAFFYATLHLATYIFLFSGYDVVAALSGIKQGHLTAIWTQAKAIWPDVLDDLKKRRFIQVGFLAWLILLALAVTSPTFMLRRMGGKNWQRLHRLVYLAAIAACIHYWWLVKTGVRRPLPDTLILALLLSARLGWTILKKRRTPAPRRATQTSPARL